MKILIFTLILFLAKAPMDYFFHINTRIITVICFFILTLYVLYNIIQNKKYYKSYYLLNLYNIIRALIEIFIYKTPILQPIFGFLIIFIFSSLCQIALHGRIKIYKEKFVLIFSVFIISSFISIIQFFHLPGSKVLSLYGGNIISGNSIGLIRTNGGIGGTPIDYAIFIIINFYIIVNYIQKKHKTKEFILIVLLIISIILNFSRIVIICIILYILYLYMYEIKKVYIHNRINKTLLLILIIAIIIINIFIYSNNLSKYVVLFQYDIHRINSDTLRVGQWQDALSILNNIGNLLIGQSFGRNIGFPVGQEKIIGDGYFLSYILDSGIVGFTIYIIFIFNIFKRMINDSKNNKKLLKSVYMMIFSFIIFNIIDSGFAYHVNMVMFSILIASVIQKKKKIDLLVPYKLDIRG